MESQKSPNLKIYDILNQFHTPREIEYETFIFYGGEVHIKIKEEFITSRVRIDCRMNGSDDLMRLAVTVDALRRMGVSYIEAYIPYIPYARQDRVMTTGESLSIKVFASILNSLKLNRVICYDAHSDVTTALIDNIENRNNFGEVDKFIIDHIKHDRFVVVSPDLGAHKKIFKMCQYLKFSNETKIINASKIRDLNTGDIVSTEIYGDVNRKNCLLVDDVIDGGKTFLELAKKLKEMGADRLYLFASHGIFSKGYDELLGHYEIIGTTDSIRDEYPEPIKVMELNTNKHI